MRARSVVVAAIAMLAAGVGCRAHGPGAASPTSSASPKKEGAVMLASPGRGTPPFVVAGAPQDVVRGRVRWHVDADGGATRARVVTHDPSTSALRLPSWLGGGVALVAEGGVTFIDVSGAPHPLFRGAVTSPSIGAHELWLRMRHAGEGDWLRVEGTPEGLTTKASYASPPIAAPLLAAWSTMSDKTLAGRPLTTGPEFVSPKIAFAIVDVLGPIVTMDAGETWRPLDAAPIREALGPAGATRILRLAGTVALANDHVFAPLSPTGQLGAPSPIAEAHEVAADAASIRLENAAIHAVPLDDGALLVPDGGRLATATLDPVRVLHVARSSELTHCELRPPTTKGPALAVAACTRHDEESASAGAQLVVGVIETGPHGPQLVPERVLPLPTAFRFSATGAIVVAGKCSSADAGGIDFAYASHVCVRDGAGKWRESVLAGISSRVDVVPRLDGGLIVARTDANKHLEIVSVPAGASLSTVPSRLRVDVEPTNLDRTLVSLDEISPGRVVVWRKIGDALEALTLSTDGGLSIVARAPSIKIDKSVYGTFGDHALVAKIEQVEGKPRVGVVSVTRDAGKHWEAVDWPASARILEPQVGRIECGALGCKLFGWTRIGWQRAVASVDDVVDLANAKELPPMPDSPPRVSELHATCTEIGAPAPFDPAKIPVDHLVSPWAWNTVDKSMLLGMPEPKMAPGFSLELASLGHGAVRGSILGWGPTLGGWTDLGRMQVRFTTDLDPIGTAHDTSPIPSPFADRASFQRARGGFEAYALAPGRVFLAVTELGRVTRAWRAVAGQPLEHVDLSALGDVTDVVNARELGDTLMIVGTTIPHEPPSAAKAQPFPEPVPFVALVSPTGAVVTKLARSAVTGENGVLGTVDLARGRFGLAVYEALPTWEGGATYVVPLRVDSTPSGSFEVLGPAPTEIAQPVKACTSTSPGWERGDTGRTRTLALAGPMGVIVMRGSGATIRERLTPGGVCLDRFTLLAASSAAQLDPASGEVTWLDASLDGKSATKRRFACADFRWQ